jgi:hypothetical protein
MHPELAAMLGLWLAMTPAPKMPTPPAPLLETAQERIVLLPPRPGDPSDQRWTERQRLDGSGYWQTAYAVDCKQRRLKRLNPPDEETAAWFTEKPYTLSSQLLKQVCGRH